MKEIDEFNARERLFPFFFFFFDYFLVAENNVQFCFNNRVLFFRRDRRSLA